MALIGRRKKKLRQERIKAQKLQNQMATIKLEEASRAAKEARESARDASPIVSAGDPKARIKLRGFKHNITAVIKDDLRKLEKENEELANNVEAMVNEAVAAVATAESLEQFFIDEYGVAPEVANAILSGGRVGPQATTAFIAALAKFADDRFDSVEADVADNAEEIAALKPFAGVARRSMKLGRRLQRRIASLGDELFEAGAVSSGDTMLDLKNLLWRTPGGKVLNLIYFLLNVVSVRTAKAIVTPADAANTKLLDTTFFQTSATRWYHRLVTIVDPSTYTKATAQAANVNALDAGNMIGFGLSASHFHGVSVINPGDIVPAEGLVLEVTSTGVAKITTLGATDVGVAFAGSDPGLYFRSDAVPTSDVEIAVFDPSSTSAMIPAANMSTGIALEPQNVSQTVDLPAIAQMAAAAGLAGSDNWIAKIAALNTQTIADAVLGRAGGVDGAFFSDL